MPLLGRGHGLIELDQAFSGSDQFAFVDIGWPERRQSPVAGQLGLAAGDDLAGGRGDDVDLAEGGPYYRDAEDPLRLPLPQRFLLVLCQRREKIADDRARAGLDLDRHRHAGTELDELVLHLHVRAVE